MQTSIKGSFFKQKSKTDRSDRDTDKIITTSQTQQEVENEEKEESMDVKDPDSGCHGDGEDKTLTSKQKLSAFAFKQPDS